MGQKMVITMASYVLQHHLGWRTQAALAISQTGPLYVEWLPTWATVGAESEADQKVKEIVINIFVEKKSSL